MKGGGVGYLCDMIVEFSEGGRVFSVSRVVFDCLAVREDVIGDDDTILSQ